MGPRKRSESLGSSGCFRLCNKIMTRSTGNFESKRCNVPQSPGSAANPASCSVSRSPHATVSRYLPAPGRKAAQSLARFFAIKPVRLVCISSSCRWDMPVRFVMLGYRIRAIRGSTDCDSNLLGLRALFSGQQILLDPRRIGFSSAQCQLAYGNAHQHDDDGGQLRKLLSERIRFL
jgi:hypothetical protein